jgi:hypothetical protein
MQLSNDVKWNKIQQIMKLIPDAVKFEMLYQYLEAVSHSDALKLVNRDTWILANKIYDVAVDELEQFDEYDPDDEVCLPYHYSDVIKVVFELSQFTTTDKWKYIMRDRHWELYDYNNS